MKWPFFLVILILFLLFLTTNTHKNTVEKNTVNTKKAICFLSASFSDKLYEFVKELAKDDTEQDYDFYICIDKGVESDINNNNTKNITASI